MKTRLARQVRGRLVKRTGTLCVFECPNGHRSQHDYGKGPVSKRIPDGPVFAKFARAWARPGGITYKCHKCTEEAIDG